MIGILFEKILRKEQAAFFSNAAVNRQSKWERNSFSDHGLLGNLRNG